MPQHDGDQVVDLLGGALGAKVKGSSEAKASPRMRMASKWASSMAWRKREGRLKGWGFKPRAPPTHTPRG